MTGSEGKADGLSTLNIDVVETATADQEQLQQQQFKATHEDKTIKTILLLVGQWPRLATAGMWSEHSHALAGALLGLPSPKHCSHPAAMEAEAMPMVKSLNLTLDDPPRIAPPAPSVSYSGEDFGARIHLVCCGEDQRAGSGKYLLLCSAPRSGAAARPSASSLSEREAVARRPTASRPLH